MNNLYQKTIKNIFLGFISVFLVVAFIGCDTKDDNNGASDRNITGITDCLPGQKC